MNWHDGRTIGVGAYEALALFYLLLSITSNKSGGVSHTPPASRVSVMAAYQRPKLVGGGSTPPPAIS